MPEHTQKMKASFSKTFFTRGIPVSLALIALLVGVMFASGVLRPRSAAHADPTLFQASIPTFNSNLGADPWGITFDKNGNVWVAEPQCDVNVGNPTVCSHATNTGILEYAASGFSSFSSPIRKLVEPTGYTSPFFLTFDSAGNLWFTEPVSNSIGEYDSGGNWHQWTVTTPNAGPLDLTFDQFGHIWFTEMTQSVSKIGVFDPGTGAVLNEFSTPTPNSRPYGITTDPSGTIWFTENSQFVHRIGSLIPTNAGGISGTIQEYLTTSPNSNGNTPHLITSDKNGNIWWSEGYDGYIGKLVISQASNGTGNGVTEYQVPCPSNPCTQQHISGIAVDSHGTVWFDDALNSLYGSFDPITSKFSTYIIDGCINNDHPHDGLAVDGNDNVWFTEEFANRLAEALPGTPVNPTPCPTATVPTSSPTTQPSPSPTFTPSPSPTPNPSPGPVNPTWYFAEGRAGGGFQEWLSVDNPLSVACQVSIQYLYTPDRGSPQTKTINTTVGATTRLSENVDQDLGTSPTRTGINVSTIVSVTNTSTCAGVVAERPMYFSNVFGVYSGHDTLGATRLGKTFYFADVSSAPGYRDFLSILNPPGGSAATISVTYYANGAALASTDTLKVAPGTRGSLTPRSFGMHVAAVVTSDQPVVVERPAYFSKINGGNAGTVSGADTVLGAPALASDWLFAEGYTGGKFQEYFVIANLDAVNKSASVTITLEPSDGTTIAPITVSVAAFSTLTWSVNGAAPNKSVSAEITSSGAKIVVERQMFFQYNHVANGRTLVAQGGTDVMGQIGPAQFSSYSFAEGYVNVGYDQWLTLQNPTANTETVTITLVNGQGKVYSFSLNVGGHTRSTVDIVHTVLQNMCAPGAVSACWEISMTTQTGIGGPPFVAERPMYFNASGSQGGTDIIGYTGG